MDAYEVGKRIGEMLRADRDRGGIGPLERYQGYFPGFDELIAREYAIVAGTGDSATDSGTLDWLPTPEQQRYTRLGEIARGGMGSIIRIRDETLRRDLAMKVVLTDLDRPASGSQATPPPLVRRFLDEARITAQLDHPGVVPVHEMGTDGDGRVFFTMKLVKGRTLGEVFELSRSGDPEWSRNFVIQVFIRVLETLAFAHEKGVVHRDLKPENVMVGDFGEVYVMDWGLAFVAGSGEPAAGTVETGGGPTDSDARLTAVGQVLGTPAYMPVEQARGGEIDARTDIYAVGAMLYEFVSGSHPYAGSGERISAMDVVRALLAGPPEPLAEAPPEIAAIVGKAMSRERRDRYPGALDLARDLRNFVEGRVVEVHRTGAWIELRKWVGRNRATATAIAAALLLLIAGLAVSTALTAEARFRERQANREVYRGGVEAAAAEIAARSVLTARARLERLRPELRGWEWRHLASQLDGSVFDLPASQFAVQPDGRVFLGGPGPIVRELDLESGGSKVVRTVEFARWPHSNESRFLRMTSESGSRYVWFRPASADPVLDLTGEYIMVANAGSRILRARDGVMHLLECDSGRTLSWPAPRAEPLALTTDGQILVLWRVDTRTIELVRSGSREIVATIEGLERVVSGAVGLSPDGSRLAVGTSRSLLIFDATTGRPVDFEYAEGHTDTVECVAFGPDGRVIATGSRDRTIRVLDAASGETLRVLVGHEREITNLAFSVDGGRLISIGGLSHLRVWDLSALRDPFALKGHASFIYAVALSPDGRRVVSAGWDGYAGKPGCVRIWDRATGEPVAALGPPDRLVDSLAISPDGTRIYTCGRSSRDDFQTRSLRVWDAETGRPLPAPTGEPAHVAASPDGRLLALAEADPDREPGWKVRLLDPVSFREVAERSLPDWVERMAFSPEGDRLAAASRDGTLRVWETGRFVRLAEFRLGEADPDRTSFSNGLSFSPDGRRLLLSASDGTIRVWDTAAWRHLATMRGHAGEVFHAIQSPDGRRIFSGGRDRKVRVWDAETFELITDLPAHESYVYTLALSRDGETLVSGSGDGTLRIWETRPARDRQRAIAERRRLVAELRPVVEALFERHVEAEKVVAELHSTLTGRRREVALQIALGQAVERRR